MALTGTSLHRQIHGNSPGWACWVWTQGGAALVCGKKLLLRSGFLWLLHLKVMWPNNVISLWTIQIIGETFHHSKMQCFVALISHVHMRCIKPQKQCSHRWKHCYFIFSFNFWKAMECLSTFRLKKPYFAVRSLWAADLSRVKSKSSSSELGPGSKGAFSQWDFEGLICAALGVNQVFWTFCQIIDWFYYTDYLFPTVMYILFFVLLCLLQ